MPSLLDVGVLADLLTGFLPTESRKFIARVASSDRAAIVQLLISLAREMPGSDTCGL